MKCRIRNFGVVREIMGGKELDFEFSGTTVADLRAALFARYPDLVPLNSLFVAVNQQYAQEDTALRDTDEIALIPPVAGG